MILQILHFYIVMQIYMPIFTDQNIHIPAEQFTEIPNF